MNTIEITPIANHAEIQPVANAVTVSLFDIYTTTYFLSEAMTLEEHKEVGTDGVCHNN